MLKMSLNEIRGKIQMYPENWVNMYSTNCYAYALGLDIRQSDICDYAYQPGTISETTNIFKSKYFSYDMLIKGIESDLELLQIAYRNVEEDEKLALNEWKIALFVDKYHGSLIDFHFLRQMEYGYKKRVTKELLAKEITVMKLLYLLVVLNYFLIYIKSVML